VPSVVPCLFGLRALFNPFIYQILWVGQGEAFSPA